ncbi:ATP-binding protein [Pengzhenrongella sicca]|uniref:ATP-binding protein n=1 Tax=Pengzhenrongella sicca TaxID=2819238 RepID=A0A8A4ZEM0_9MICO|nr:ATP-binding protein [Pengzhenrongella sicca]QTE29755.1 ATP-binding protein [Pengzhenrongella sicca]
MGDADVPRAKAAESSRTHLRSITGGRQDAPGSASPTAFPPGGGSVGGRAARPELSLPARTSSGRPARHWVMNELAADGVYGLANQIIELLTGELVANSALHGPADGTIRVTAWRTGAIVRVAVRDESPAEPVVRHPEVTAASGRGLLLVATLSTDWGIERHGADGKTVWFSVDLDRH